MKEIYEILQKPTAKGRLLAEQVPPCLKVYPLRMDLSHVSSVDPSTGVSNPFVLMEPRRTVYRRNVPTSHTKVPT
jgi:hypothetical protein